MEVEIEDLLFSNNQNIDNQLFLVLFCDFIFSVHLNCVIHCLTKLHKNQISTCDLKSSLNTCLETFTFYILASQIKRRCPDEIQSHQAPLIPASSSLIPIAIASPYPYSTLSFQQVHFGLNHETVALFKA